MGATTLLLLGFACPAGAQRMRKAEEPDEVGLVSVGGAYFPAPAGVETVRIPNGGFEDRLENTDRLQVSRWLQVERADAPEGLRYLENAEKGPSSLVVNLPASPLSPVLLSMWLKSGGALSGLASCLSDEIYYGQHTPLNLPDTRGRWRRVGFYLRAAPGTTAIRISLNRPADGPAVALDDVRFREATEAEFSAAYAGWRAGYPARDLSPRPDDGKNLALFVSKLRHPESHPGPLKIVGIGSSYTNMLGNGERIVQWIREKFPDAPPVEYRKHVGSAVNYDFTKGWMRQYVLRERPDLVILYSGGEAADLEELLADFRAHSTADVIVASLHLRERDEEITGATVNAPEWDAIRDVALKYGCEWVDNRREWAAYLREHEKPIEWLLKDAVHQNDHGALVINENICRHIAPAAQAAADPDTREKWLAVSETENASPLSRTIRFRGNRIDLLGIRSPEGPVVDLSEGAVTLDGRPLAEAPAFVTTLIVPGAKNARPERGSAADRSPHLVRLGPAKAIVPQDWTLKMVSDTGAYELIGSVTGHDGYGHNGEDFTGNSGQITVPSALWRRRLEADGVNYTNRTGDLFTWRVERAVASRISFDGPEGEVFAVTLAAQLETADHTLRLDSFPGRIAGFSAFCPPFAPEGPVSLEWAD